MRKENVAIRDIDLVCAAITQYQGFPGGSVVKTCLQCRRQVFHPWDGKIPLEKGMATHSSICAWKIPWTGGPGRL